MIFSIPLHFIAFTGSCPPPRNLGNAFADSRTTADLYEPGDTVTYKCRPGKSYIIILILKAIELVGIIKRLKTIFHIYNYAWWKRCILKGCRNMKAWSEIWKYLSKLCGIWLLQFEISAIGKSRPFAFSTGFCRRMSCHSMWRFLGRFPASIISIDCSARYTGMGVWLSTLKAKAHPPASLRSMNLRFPQPTKIVWEIF